MMKKTVAMWAVFDPEGKIVDWTLRPDAEWAKDDFLISFTWDYYETKGYTCRQVRVTIEEIKNE